MEVDDNYPLQLKFGQIIFLKTHIQSANQENRGDYVISGDGFMIKYLFLNKIDNNDDDFSNSLFQIVPTHEEIFQRSIIKQIKDKDRKYATTKTHSTFTDIENDKMHHLELAVQSDQNKKQKKEFKKLLLEETEARKKKLGKVEGTITTKILTQLETSLNTTIQKFQANYNQPLGFNKPFQLYHLRSGKFLSLKSSNTSSQSGPMLQDNDSRVQLEDYSGQYSFLQIIPGYQFQNDIAREGEDIYLSSYGEGHGEVYAVLQTGIDNSYDLMVNSTAKTFFNICVFTDDKIKNSDKIHPGDTVWIQNQNKQQQISHNKESINALQNFCFNQFMIKSGLFKSKKLVQKKSEISEFSIDKNSHSILNLWKIEHENVQIGRFLKFSDKVRLRCLKNGEYLQVIKENQKYIAVNCQQKTEDTLFRFINVSKDKKIDAHIGSGLYLTLRDLEDKLKQAQSQQNFHNDGKKMSENSESKKLNLIEYPSKQDCFRLLKASPIEIWEANFLNSALPILLFNINYLKEYNTYSSHDQVKQEVQKKNSLLILKMCLVELWSFCQNENKYFSAYEHKLKVIDNSYRQHQLKEYGFINYLAQIPYNLFPQAIDDNQLPGLVYEIYKQNQQYSKNKGLVQEGLSVLVSSLLKGQDYTEHQHKKNQMLLYQQIAQICYRLISEICIDNNENQFESLKYFKIFKYHIGLKLGVEKCIQHIAEDNEEILKILFEFNIDEENQHKIVSQKSLKITASEENISNLKDKVNSQSCIINFFFVRFLQIEKILQNKLPEQRFYFNEFIDFLISITAIGSQDQCVTVNQLMISYQIEQQLDKNDIFIQMRLNIPADQQQLDTQRIINDNNMFIYIYS